VLLGPGHSLYSSVDEKLNEMLVSFCGGIAVFVDGTSDVPYRIHFFEAKIKGQNTNGEAMDLHGELVAVREEIAENSSERFSVVPADCLLDLPAHSDSPSEVEPIDAIPASDFLKSTYQMEVRARCQEERRHFVDVCREYLERSFDARMRAAQDRVMELRAREANSPEIAIARQRAENDLADLERTRRERIAGLDRLMLAKHGPVRHLGTAIALPSAVPAAAQISYFAEDIDPAVKRRVEKAAEDIVVAYEEARGWSCQRVGHLKLGFDIRSLGQADSQTGYRDPIEGIRRIEVKGRARGQPIRLTTNEWYKATHLGDSYWLYVVWDPLQNPHAEPIRIQNPVKHLDHVKREIIAARYYDIPAEALERLVLQQGG
jgi:hypothetical protein